VKVTDFGIARITDSSKTKTGLVLGTPSFMSPEQIAGKRVDGRSDLYSLGVMLFQMLAGVLPFRGDSMAELMYKIANEEAPDIRIVRPELSEEIARIVAHALRKKPEERYQDGERFAADLRAAVSNAPAASGSGALAAGGAGGGGEKTVAFATQADAAGAAAGAFEATQVGQAPPAAATPSYDATQKIDQAAPGAFDKTAVISRPGATGFPEEGSGEPDLQA